MKKLLFLYTFLLSFGINNIYSQLNKREEFYLKILKKILTKNIFDNDKMMIIFKNDTCLFYNRCENFIDNTEKRLEFKFEKYSVKVWPGDHVFIFYDKIRKSIKITDFKFTEDSGTVNIELCIDERISKGFEIFFIKKKESWKIKNVKEKTFNNKDCWGY